MLVTVVPFLCHKATGLTRGYWRSTDAPVQTSTVLPRDDVLREANRDVTQVTDIPDRDDTGKQPVPGVMDGVDGGLLRPWPARKRGQSRRGSSGHFYDNYPDFPSTTIQPKRGSNKNIYKLVKYVSLSFVTVQCFYLSKVFLILSIYICLSVCQVLFAYLAFKPHEY